MEAPCETLERAFPITPWDLGENPKPQGFPKPPSSKNSIGALRENSPTIWREKDPPNFHHLGGEKTFAGLLAQFGGTRFGSPHNTQLWAL